MEKLKQKLKYKVKDEVAAFTILGSIIITFFITIAYHEYKQYTEVEKANADINYENIQEESKSKENFETIENVTSQEELKKLSEKEDKDKKQKSEQETSKYYIKVNYGAQVVNIYTKDSNGKYTVPVKAMVCSTGIHTPTSGVYTIGYRWEWLEMIGSVYGHYVTQICGDILFHSVPYLEKGNHSSLEWWAYDQLGTKASLGCVRLTTKDALWIFNNVSSGTKVEFYSSSTPGPLGKPSAMKISNAPNYVKGWDPTDPDSRNPWPKYLKSKDKEDNNNTNKVEESKDKDKDKDNDKDNDKDKDEDKDKPNSNTTVDKNEVENEVENEVSNEIVNETVNEIVNEITNSTKNEEIKYNEVSI